MEINKILNGLLKITGIIFLMTIVLMLLGSYISLLSNIEMREQLYTEIDGQTNNTIIISKIDLACSNTPWYYSESNCKNDLVYNFRGYLERIR